MAFRCIPIGRFCHACSFCSAIFLSESLEKLHDLKGIKKGFVLAIPLFFLCISSYVAGRKIKGSIPLMRKIILISLILMSGSIVFVGYTKEKIVLLLIITSVLGIAIDAMLPTLDALITENIEKTQRGTISSFYSSARFIGVAAGPPLMSVLMKNYLNISYIIAGVFGIILLCLAFKLLNENTMKMNDREDRVLGFGLLCCIHLSAIFILLAISFSARIGFHPLKPSIHRQSLQGHSGDWEIYYLFER